MRTALLGRWSDHALAFATLALGAITAGCVVYAPWFVVIKQINDTHGHLAGDEALRAVGEVLADELRGYDAVGRFGGEEFVALLPEVDVDDAPRVAERVRRRIESLRVVDGGADARQAPLSASVGVAVYPQHGTELDALIRSADQALYAAKDAGRNVVCVAATPVPRSA